MPRGSVPPATGGIGGPIGPTGGVGYYYPWWWFGGAGLYGSYWGYNYYGYPGYYGSGGYYGYSDPWFGGYPDAQDPMPSGGTSGGGWVDEGTLKLKIKPNTAEVYVDGFYVGVVDDFDGMRSTGPAACARCCSSTIHGMARCTPHPDSAWTRCGPSRGCRPATRPPLWPARSISAKPCSSTTSRA